VLQPADLGPIRRRVAHLFARNTDSTLPYRRSILSSSPAAQSKQVVSVMNSSLELIEHRIDLRYGLIRLHRVAHPDGGFIGTVSG